MLRWRWFAVLTAGAVGCARIDFGDGSGASPPEGGASSSSVTTTAGGGDEGGAGAGMQSTVTTANGCPTSSCSPDRRCGDDGCMGLCGGIGTGEPWGVSLDVSGLYIEPWPETQSVFFASDHSRVVRIDTCDGTVMAEHHLSPKTSVRSVRAIGRYDEELMVAYNQPTGPGGAVERWLLVLDARSLVELGPPIFVGAVGVENGFWTGAAGIDGIWATLAEGAAFTRVTPGGGSCALSFAADGDSLGLGVLGARTVAAFRPAAGAAFQLYDLSGCGATCCQQAGAIVPGLIFTDDFEPRLVALGPTGVYAAGWLPDATPTTGCGTALRSRVVRGSADIQDTLAIWESDPASCIDAFTSVAVYGGAVYASGTQDAIGQLAGGAARVVKLSESFVSGDAPLADALIAGAQLSWATAADENGVYLTGLAGAGGFAVKCSHDLTCGGITGPGSSSRD